MGTRTKEIIKGKSSQVNALSKEIEEYGAFLVFEYLGLNSEEMVLLRRSLRECDAKLAIHKNNVLNRTFKNLKLNNSEEMKGPNAIVLTKRDMKPFKNVIKLSKEKDFVKLKLACFDNEIIEKENLKVLESLGSKEDILVKFARTLMSPLYKLVYLVKNIEK